MECDRWIICIYLILIIVCTTIKTTHADDELQGNTTASPETNSTEILTSQSGATYKNCSGLEVCQILLVKNKYEAKKISDRQTPLFTLVYCSNVLLICNVHLSALIFFVVFPHFILYLLRRYWMKNFSQYIHQHNHFCVNAAQSDKMSVQMSTIMRDV